MSIGTTDTSSTKLDDPVLGSAMAELATEGFNADDPVDSSTQDEAGSVQGTNPIDTQSTTTSDPATDGKAAPISATSAQQSEATDQSITDDDDPRVGAEPVQVTVDGQTRKLDGFYRWPGEGIFIDEDKVPAFQLMASRAEGLERQNRELYQKTQEYEKLSQWTTKAQDGTDKTLSGRDALEARDMEIARLKAWSSTLAEVMLNPGELAALLGGSKQDQNGQFVAGLDPQQIKYLEMRAELASRDAMEQVKSKFAQTYQNVTQEHQQAQQREQAPQALWQSAQQAWAPQFPQLTSDDKTFLSSQVPNYTRIANQQEVQSGQFKSGELVLDQSFYSVMQDRANLRAQLAATTTSNTQANKFNAGQLQGRRGAQKPGQKPAQQNTQPPSGQPAQKKGRQDAWDETFNQAMQELAV